MKQLVSIVAVVALAVIGTVGSSAPAMAADGRVTDIQVSVLADGTAPFSTNDGPGLDTAAKNGIVRTQDSIRYRVQASYDIPGDVTFASTLPQGMEWDATATAATVCSGGGSLSDGNRTLTCKRTTSNEGGLSESFELLAWVYSVGNGATVQPTVTSGTASGTADAVTVSAQPATELKTSLISYAHNTSLGGKLGLLAGQRFMLGATSADGDLRGFEAFGDTVTFQLRVPEASVVHSLAVGRGGGTLSYTQAGPGETVFVTLTNARTDFGSVINFTGFPKEFWGNVFLNVNLWIPYDPTLPTGQKTTVEMQVSGFDPDSLSGVSNFGDGVAPGQAAGYVCPSGTLLGAQLSCWRDTFDRTQTLVVGGTFGGVMGADRLYLFGDGHGYPQNEEKVLPGQAFRAFSGVMNASSALESASSPFGCAVWDSSLLRLNGDARGIYSNQVSNASIFHAGGNTALPAGSYRLEYSAVSFASDAERKAFDCGQAGDGAAGWTSDPAAVAGGAAAVGAIRILATGFNLKPGSAVGLDFSLARTTSAASLALPVNAGLPWFWQFGTAETALVKSTYSGTSYSLGGGYVQAVPALVRATTSWSAASVDPGALATVTVRPLVIGPVGAGINTVAKNTQARVSLNSVCAEPVLASLDALVAGGAVKSYTIVPGEPNDPINCAKGGTPANIVFQLGDVTAAGGTAGGTFHPTVAGHETLLSPLSFQVVNSVLTPSGSKHTVKTVMSSDSDTSRESWDGVTNQAGSAVLTDRTTEATLVVTGVASFAGGKSAATANNGYVAPGEVFSYTLSWANGTSNDVGRGTFVDVLPFDGDSRGTTGLGKTGLNVLEVQASMADEVMGKVAIEYTTDDRATVEAAVNRVGNENGNADISWKSGAIPTTATAVRFTTESLLRPGYSGTATISTSVDRLARNGKVINTMSGRTEPVDGDPNSVMSFRDASSVNLKSSASSLSGTVYRDLDFDGVLSPADIAWGKDLEITATSVGDAASTTTGTDSGFLYEVIAPGSYSFSAPGSGWDAVAPVDPVAVASGVDVTGQVVMMQERIAAPALVDDATSARVGSSVSVDVTANDTLAFPTAAGSVFTRDTVALGATVPTHGSVELTAPTDAQTQSTVTYTAHASWPTEYAGKGSYTDTFTYTWTNAAGVSETAEVSVLVYAALVATDDVGTMPDATRLFDVLGNDAGDAPAFSGAPTVASGDADVTVVGGSIQIAPTHSWADGEKTHDVVVSYQIEDAHGQTAQATLTVTVVRAPVVNGNRVDRIGQQGSAVFGPEVLHPEVLDAVELTVSPGAGAAEIDADTELVTFSANGAADGRYAFTVAFTDELGQRTEVVYTVAVQAVPRANDVTASTGLGLPVEVNTRVSTSGSIVSAEVIGAPAGAEVSVDAAGGVSFDPGEVPVGDYTFTVRYTDDLGQSGEATVTVRVSALAVTGETSALIPGGSSTDFAMTVVAESEVRATVTTRPDSGTVTVNDANVVTFDAGNAEDGTYTFTVQFADEDGNTVEADYTVRVQAPPVVSSPPSQKIPTGGSLGWETTISTSGTVTGAELSGLNNQLPAGTPVTVATDGSVHVDASGMQPGTYSFTVTFTDDLGQAGEATYNFTVQAPPLGEGHATTITDTETATFDPFGDSSGIGLQPLDASVIVQPASGSVGITDGTVTYTPVLGFVGDVWFSVTITDDLGQTVVLTYTVTVVPAELLPKVGETAGATDVANPSHPLSMTGGELGGLLALCATLLLVGALLIVRRKKHAVRPRVE